MRRKGCGRLEARRARRAPRCLGRKAPWMAADWREHEIVAAMGYGGREAGLTKRIVVACSQLGRCLGPLRHSRPLVVGPCVCTIALRKRAGMRTGGARGRGTTHLLPAAATPAAVRRFCVMDARTPAEAPGLDSLPLAAAAVAAILRAPVECESRASSDRTVRLGARHAWRALVRRTDLSSRVGPDCSSASRSSPRCVTCDRDVSRSVASSLGHLVLLCPRPALPMPFGEAFSPRGNARTRRATSPGACDGVASRLKIPVGFFCSRP